MSTSTDSLKKKVCVTVFLDELFEEVLDEDRIDLKEVAEVAVSDVELTTEQCKDPSGIHLNNDEEVNVSLIANLDLPRSLPRPRKPRKESKFSKNCNDSFKEELSKYGYCENIKAGNDCCDPTESPVSDTDFDLEELLEMNKWAVEDVKTSSSEHGELDVTEESLLSINPVLSTIVIPCPKERKGISETERVASGPLFCNKFTQMDEVAKGEEAGEKVGEDVRVEKEGQNGEEDVLALKKTQQVELILAKANHVEEGTYEGNRIRRYNIRSILEECVRQEGKVVTKIVSGDFGGHNLSDSYTCIFPHNKRRNKTGTPELKRVCTCKKRKVWNDDFESDLSEADCTRFAREIGLRSIQNDSLLCYRLCLKCNESVYESREREGNLNLVTIHSTAKLGSSSEASSFESLKSKATEESDICGLKAVTHLTNKRVPERVLNADCDVEEEEKEKAKIEEDFSTEIKKKMSSVEARNKNFADGDTFEKPNLVDFRAKEKLLVCDEILKNIEETKLIQNNILVNLAEVNLNSQVESSSFPSKEDITEVFFKKGKTGLLEKYMTDPESEMVFAESENSCKNEEFLADKYLVDTVSTTTAESKSYENCFSEEFEDKLCNGNILRRMKTVHILGNNSLSDMKNISTEVILICENFSNNEICLEAWQSITEMGQCYLKDSKNSAMHLIEIPFHFIYPKKEGFSESKSVFKTSDSE